MTAKWGSGVILAVCLAILAGCRTNQPNLKPDITASTEQFNAPPMDARYESPAYPKQAFDTPADPGRRNFDAKGGAVMPARGGGGGMPGMGGGMSGMPGMR